MLSPEETDLLRRSFQAVCRNTPEVIELFYRRLFEIAPETRLLFRGDMRLQSEKLQSTLGATIAQIHDIPALQPMLADLARRHVNYGVAPRHYPLVGEALFWAIERSLGPDYDPEVDAVWRTAYRGIAEAMVAAAYGGEASRVA